MSLKSKVLSQIDKDEQDRASQAKILEARKSAYNRCVDEKSKEAEVYYKKYLFPILLEVYAMMGGSGPNPDGSLPWRGGKFWTISPERTSSLTLEKFEDETEIKVTIKARVVWDVEKWSRGRTDSGTIEWGAVWIQVDNFGNAVCGGETSKAKNVSVDLKQTNAYESLESAVAKVIRELKDQWGRPYEPRNNATIKLPDWLLLEQNVSREIASKNIYEKIVLPILREVASRKGINLSKNPYTKYNILGNPMSGSHSVPVTPGIFEVHENAYQYNPTCVSTSHSATLIFRIISIAEYERKSVAWAVELRAGETNVFVRIGDKYQGFDVTHQKGIDELVSFLNKLVDTRPTITFYPPQYDNPSP